MELLTWAWLRTMLQPTSVAMAPGRIGSPRCITAQAEAGAADEGDLSAHDKLLKGSV